MPADCLAQVRTVATDAPGPELLKQLQAVMPNLELLVLNLVHIAFLFESAQGRAKTSAGQTLRAIQAKWNKVDSRVQLPQLSGALRMSERALVARDMSPTRPPWGCQPPGRPSAYASPHV